LIAALSAVPFQTPPAQTPSSSPQQISNVLDEWSAGWKTRNPEALRALYTHNAKFFPAVDRSVVGQDAIGDYFKNFFTQLDDSMISHGENISQEAPEISGELAYSNGVIMYFTKGKCRAEDSGGGPCVVKGYDLIVLKRGEDGKWRIVRQSLTQIGWGSTVAR
jgi:ketosteroid isomerase-like protein